MTTKENLLKLFELKKGVYVSGEEIAKELNISRAAVWKGVKTLQEEGYAIQGITNKGYCLSIESDIISSMGIQKYLDTYEFPTKLCVLPTVNSTNAYLREKAIDEMEGYTVISREQTAGRGRFHRSFYSPLDTGIYMSILLRPKHHVSNQPVHMTILAAVAMCEAIESISYERPQIKWVNDIYIRGKKVCGILTEGFVSMESGMLEYAILGVGMNVYQPVNGFPEEIEHIAGSVFQTSQKDAKNRLTAAFLNRFAAYYTMHDTSDYVAKYRMRSMIIGKQVYVNTMKQAKRAMVLGIDDCCRLLVQYADGKKESLSSGEISITL